jgi:hypothetical protein
LSTKRNYFVKRFIEIDSTPPTELLLDPKPTKANSPVKLSFTKHTINSDLNMDMDLVEYEYNECLGFGIPFG